MSLNIAQFTFGMQLAGQERVVVDLAKSFKRSGCKSIVCTTLFGGELSKELKAAGIPFHCFNLRRSYAPTSIIDVMQYLKKNDIDVVITHGSSGCMVPRIAAMLRRMPAFIHVEHNISDYKKKYHILANRIMTGYTDKIVCISENARKSLLSIERPKEDKVTVIPNGLDVSRFSNVKSPYRTVNGLKKIGIIGRFVEQKGHIYFIEAARELIKVYKSVQFLFIGDGPLRGKIEQKVKEYGLNDYCEFLGVRPDACDLLQKLDIFVLASLWEGLPITLLEAQYFGIPSVVTSVGGNPEIIKHEYNGLLVPPGNPSALSSALHRLLIDKDLGRLFCKRGKEVFEKKFSVEKMANSYLDLIRGIIEKKKFR